MNETISGTPITPEKLTAFLLDLNRRRNHHSKDECGEITAEMGRKYIRLVTERRSVYAFLDIATGDILKADGLKKPAKRFRGNIRRDWWGTALGPYGAAYLR